MTDWLTIQPADRHKTIMRPHRKDILSIRKQTKKIHNYFFLPPASSCWILMAVSRHLLGNQIPVLWSLLWLEYGQGSGLRETWQLIWEKIGKLIINLGWCSKAKKLMWGEKVWEFFSFFLFQPHGNQLPPGHVGI